MVLRADGVAAAVAPLPPRDNLGGDKSPPVGPDHAAAVRVNAFRVSAVSAVLWRYDCGYGLDKRVSAGCVGLRDCVSVVAMVGGSCMFAFESAQCELKRLGGNTRTDGQSQNYC